jgi:hypothetical protein
MDRQHPNANPLFAKKERSKVFKVIKKGYLRPVHRSELKSLMHYFSVPKGENDIRMVYDGSKCLLNAATFAPWFAVPTSSTLERTVLPHTIQGDNDFGDMFLNFQLHKEMQKYTGVDARDLLTNVEAKTWMQQTSSSWEETLFTWDRPAMGGYQCPWKQRLQPKDAMDLQDQVGWSRLGRSSHIHRQQSRYSKRRRGSLDGL